MSGPSVHFNLPPRSLFQFPPSWVPEPLAPPFEESSLRTPFPIPASIFKAALDPMVPATIATVYAVTVSLVNAYNRKHGNQPWRISKSRAFFAFVILHNVFLAVYSAVTCVAMFKALKRTIPHYSEENSLVGTVDALCKMHGPRGFGDAVTYLPPDNVWHSDNQGIRLGPDRLPDSTDVGRLWNEGLAFWGWIFYLSKFYEVLDTLIILAKGKRSSTLQTYHHAGAMLCMWAGIRFMSAPIWIFCLVNSGIHAMMYTYYTVSALGFRVPQRLKRSLTTLQIMQFIFGASFAGLHLFVSYTAPVQIPYTVSETVAAVASAVTSALPAGATADSLATAAGTALLKKLIYRAAGEEGLAENIPASAAAVQDAVTTQLAQNQNQSVEKLIYRTQYVEKRCIDSTGQSFAVWLNLVYLFPLTVLFVRFFIKSYIRRASASTKNRTMRRRLSKAGHDALHGVNKELESFGNAPEDMNGSSKEGGRGRAKKSGPTDSPAERQQKVVEAFNKKLSEGLAKANLNDKATAQAAKEIAGEIISRASTPKGKRSASRSIKPADDDAEGLSTTDPKEAGIAYADMAKKGAE